MLRNLEFSTGSELGLTDLEVRLAGGEKSAVTVADIMAATGAWETSYILRNVQRHIGSDEVGVYLIGPAADPDPALSIATFCLQWQDIRFWSEDSRDAGYVHRLAVRPTEQSRGIGRAALTWVEREILIRGGSRLRLDYPADNRDLKRYYEDILGFQQMSTISISGYDGVLLEKRLEPAA